MFKLKSSIKKELKLLFRDRVGLAILFLMPIILVMVITGIQDNTFKLVNDKNVRVLLCNKDTNDYSKQLINSLKELNMFTLIPINSSTEAAQVNDSMHKLDALITLVIPPNFSKELDENIQSAIQKSLSGFGMIEDSISEKTSTPASIKAYYHPVLQESYRQSMQGAFKSAVALTENQLLVEGLYESINMKKMEEKDKNSFETKGIQVEPMVADFEGKNKVPNATQHNIPAWTIFAMFFMVVSLGGNIVKEKLSGSFIRMKTLPTSYFLSIVAKQMVYLFISMLMVATIFSIGVFIFPSLNLPALNIPKDIIGLSLLTLITGWCAISFALFIGVFSETQEQCSGIGAVTVVIMAALGGVFVPSFAMPDTFHLVMKLTPFYWSLQSYYDLFLENRNIIDIGIKLIPLFLCIIVFQTLAFIGLKRKKLI